MNNNNLQGIYSESLRLGNCNFCKATLMLIIVLYHSGIFGGGYNIEYQNDSLGLFLKWLASFHNYAFVLISGYIYCYIILEKKGYNDFRTFVVKKAKRLIVPFFIVGYLWVFPIRGLFLDYSVEQFIKNFVFGINPGQLWFLFMLFWVFVSAHYLVRNLGNNTKYLSIVILTVYYAGMIIGNYLPNVFQLFTAMQYLPYFFIGFCLRKYEHALRNKELYILIAALILNVGLFGITQTIPHKGIQGTMFTLVAYPLMRLGGAVMIFLILDRLARIVPWNNRFGLFLCEASFPIYLFHEQIIYFLVPYLRDIFNPVWTMLSVFVSALLITCLLSSFLMKGRVARYAIGLQ